MLWDNDSPLEELATIDDAEELCRQLLARPCGWGTSTRHTWVSPQWMEVDLSDGTSRTYTVDEHTLGHHRPSFEPPLRRWASRRALQGNSERLEDLLRAAGQFEPRHRDALIHGLLDAAHVLDAPTRRRVIKRGLQTAQASVRRTALDRLCELDGPAKAHRRARADTNATVRKWRPPHPEPSQLPSLLGS